VAEIDSHVIAGGSPQGLRELNRSNVVDALRRHGSVSRGDLARLTGLSRTTISTLVADLKERGLIVERPGADAAGSGAQRRRGRRPILLSLNAQAGTALGIDFDHRHVRVAVADLSGEVLAERFAEVDVDPDASTALAVAVDMVGDVLAEAGTESDQLVGVVLGLPGPIDRRTGIVGSSFILPGWVDVDSGRYLSSKLEHDVRVENDANLGALGEAAFGAGRGLSDIVYIKLSSGIGSGLVLGGRLYRGAIGLAGELGHIQVRPEGAVCRCGSRGCLETIASTKALIELLRPGHGDDLTVRGLLDASAAGDVASRRVIGDAGHAVGRVLADVCNYLNPAAIVVGGELSAAGEPLFAAIRHAVDRHALSEAARSVEIKPAVLGERAEVLGALALVIADTERLNSAGLASLRQPRAAAVVSP
jgi:predicted NBD/HSP70 family sugar kinase